MIIPNEGGSDLVGTADVIVVGGGSAGATATKLIPRLASLQSASQTRAS
jgi:hypothetical protein